MPPAPNNAVDTTDIDAFEGWITNGYPAASCPSSSPAIASASSFFSGSGAGWTCSAAGQVVTCTNQGPLVPGASSSLTLTVSVANQAAPSVVNVASSRTAKQVDTPFMNDPFFRHFFGPGGPPEPEDKRQEHGLGSGGREGSAYRTPAMPHIS